MKGKISDRASLVKQLEGLGCEFSEPLTQKDVIFLPEGITFSDIPLGTPVLRVRDSNGVFTLTLKKRLGDVLDKLEKETKIDDYEQGIAIVENMGFHKALVVEKNRIQASYKDITVCLDEVKGLGSFIEVEKLTEEDSKIVQDELFAFLQTLGINERVFKGYDTMFAQK